MLAKYCSDLIASPSVIHSVNCVRTLLSRRTIWAHFAHIILRHLDPFAIDFFDDRQCLLGILLAHLTPCSIFLLIGHARAAITLHRLVDHGINIFFIYFLDAIDAEVGCFAIRIDLGLDSNLANLREVHRYLTITTSNLVSILQIHSVSGLRWA